MLITAVDHDALPHEKTFVIVERENPRFELSDALSMERAQQSLEAIYTLAEENSDKLIFTAAGNNDSDFAAAMQLLAAEGREKPINLVFVGVFFGENNSRSDGATIYLHRDAGFNSSSEATAYMSGVASYLESKGMNHLEIVYFILKELTEEMQILSPSLGTHLTARVTKFGIHDMLIDLIVVATESKGGKLLYFIPEPL